ncbi:hypothetical protein [Aliarcobacter butzleri]|uniref:hypothetical protein n=1 Tax=Aliarcobacter butzleri TaxID=28197 RepID=UPI00062E49D8|nr:hypothetical protein [Aliarcobacter butzleri]KLD98797.1 hypothetical protein AF74_01970 [Aliarcobacter butzleri L349]
MKKEFEALDLIIYVLWTLIIIFILLNLCFDFQNFILVGLAGLLASASVMKNIENTNKIEEQKVKRELFKQKAEIIFEIEELNSYIKEKDDLCQSIDIKIIQKSIKILLYSEYIFDEKDFKIIEPILNCLISYFKLNNSYYEEDVEKITSKKNRFIELSNDISNQLKDSIKLV